MPGPQTHPTGSSRGRRKIQELGQVGPVDEIGTLTTRGPEDIVAAAGL